MSGFVDLHCHYLPGIDDGVRTLEEGQRVVLGLRELGFSTVIATPHIRTAMFENRAPGLRAAYAEFDSLLDPAERPQLGLSAEHYCDDVFWDLFVKNQTLPYPGNNAILIEFHYDNWPKGIESRLFEIQVRGFRPVIAHPERYAALARSTNPIDPLLDVGALTLLDLMSLVGRYGDRACRVAERMLEEGCYDAACTDTHRPDDLEKVARAVERLRELVGEEETNLLLREHPQRILAGTYEP